MRAVQLIGGRAEVTLIASILAQPRGKDQQRAFVGLFDGLDCRPPVAARCRSGKADRRDRDDASVGRNLGQPAPGAGAVNERDAWSTGHDGVERHCAINLDRHDSRASIRTSMLGPCEVQ